jgi:flagellar hook-associated protein 1 FlgK
MPGLYSSLSNSVKALNAHSRAIETAGRNLSNVNNPSYARQRVLYGDRGTVATPEGAQSLGLEALAIQQLRDDLLDGQVTRETALKAGYEAEQSGYERAQAALGQSIDRSASAGSTSDSSTGGLAASIDDFFNAFQGFASRPTDSGERQLLIQKAGILTDRLQLTDNRLAQVQTDLDSQVDADVAEVNRLLDVIANLNGQIGSFEIGRPGSAVDLRDQRQARLEELSAKLPIETTKGAAGQLQVFARDASNNPVVLVDLATVTGPVTFTGTTITAGSPSTTLNLASGAINGSITARTGAVQNLRTSLDQLASQLVTAVNSAYNPTGLSGDFFDPTGTSASTIRLDSALTADNLKASDGGAAGDNTIALAVAGLSQQIFSTSGGDNIDGTFSDHFARSVTDLGQSLSTANARVEDQTNIEQLVRGQRDSLSGVSLDEEMADLVKYQRAYQASARVFSVVDDLLNTLVNRLGT